MKTSKWLLGFSTLAVLCALGWLTFAATASWLRSLNPVIAASLTTATLGLLGLWYAQWQSKGRDIAESHRASKIEVYSIFFSIVEKLQEGNVDPSDGSVPEGIRNDFKMLNRGLILWASPSVITAWLQFRRISGMGRKGNLLLSMDQMYKAIRKDLGNSNFGLEEGDLIRIGLKDPDEL